MFLDTNLCQSRFFVLGTTPDSRLGLIGLTGRKTKLRAVQSDWSVITHAMRGFNKIHFKGTYLHAHVICQRTELFAETEQGGELNWSIKRCGPQGQASRIRLVRLTRVR